MDLKNLPDWIWVIIVIIFGGLFYFAVRGINPIISNTKPLQDSISTLLVKIDSVTSKNKQLDSLVKVREKIVELKDSSIKIILVQKKDKEDTLAYLDKKLKELIADTSSNCNELKTLVLEQSKDIKDYQENFSEYVTEVQEQIVQKDSIINLKDSLIANQNGIILTSSSMLQIANESLAKQDIVIVGLNNKNTTNKTLLKIVSGVAVVLIGGILIK